MNTLNKETQSDIEELLPWNVARNLSPAAQAAA